MSEINEAYTEARKALPLGYNGGKEYIESYDLDIRREEIKGSKYNTKLIVYEELIVRGGALKFIGQPVDLYIENLIMKDSFHLIFTNDDAVAKTANLKDSSTIDSLLFHSEAGGDVSPYFNGIPGQPGQPARVFINNLVNANPDGGRARTQLTIIATGGMGSSGISFDAEDQRIINKNKKLKKIRQLLQPGKGGKGGDGPLVNVFINSPSRVGGSIEVWKYKQAARGGMNGGLGSPLKGEQYGLSGTPGKINVYGHSVYNSK